MGLPREAFAFAGEFSIEGWIAPGGPSPDMFRNQFLSWEEYQVRWCCGRRKAAQSRARAPTCTRRPP